MQPSPWVSRPSNSTFPPLTKDVAAALNMTEPSSTGIGGDMFCLYFDAATKKVHSLNGSGRSPRDTTLETVRKDLGLRKGQRGAIPLLSPLAVTVPGAPAGWVDTVEKFGSGKLTMEQILMPAIELGEKGFPVSEQAAHMVSRWTLFPKIHGAADGHHNSGPPTNRKSVMPHPTFVRCSGQTPRRSFSPEHRGQERYSAIPASLEHSEHLQLKGKKDSTPGALPKPLSKSCRSAAAT